MDTFPFFKVVAYASLVTLEVNLTESPRLITFIVLIEEYQDIRGKFSFSKMRKLLSEKENSSPDLLLHGHP
jgi:hypothetical protein